MSQGEELQRFEATVLPHMDAAFNLARWLLRNPADAQDVTQEAILRALRFFAALQELPPPLREILVLRELEGCSYKEIATITGRPIGTVMSALARARQRLRNSLTQVSQVEARP